MSVTSRAARAFLIACCVVASCVPGARAQSATSFFDHFDGASLHPRWVAITRGGGSVTLNDSYVEINSPSGADASAIYYNAPLDKTKSQLWVFAISNDSGVFPQWWLSLINSATPPAPGGLDPILGKMRARISVAQSGTSKGILFDYWNAAHARAQWSESANVWTAATGVQADSPIAGNDYYLVGFEVDGPQNRWRMMAWGKRSSAPGTFTSSQGLKLFALSDWVSWSAMEATDSLWLLLGEPFDNAQTGRMRVEWARYDDGPRRDIWVNGSDGVTYRIKHWYGYEGANGAVELFVPEDRTTVAVDVGPPGQWDSNTFGVKDQFVVQDGATYYLFYNNNAAGIGLATATNPNGPWIKDPANPILSGVVGTEESGVFNPGVVKDLGEPDPNATWKLIYSGFSTTDGKIRLFLATAPSPVGPWTKLGKVLDVGGVGAMDEFGVARARPIWFSDQWYVFYSVRSAAASGWWNVSYAAGPALDVLTKSNVALVPKSPGATQDLTANLSGRIVSVADSSGFVPDAPVSLQRATAIGGDFSVSRVRKILGPTSIELYHGLDGFLSSTPARIVRQDSELFSDEVAEVIQAGSNWYLYITNFGATPAESTGLLTSSTLTGPYTWNWMVTPPVTLASWGNSKSNENLTFVHQPIDTTPSQPDSTPAQLFSISSSGITAASAVIAWRTNESSTSQVEYGENTAYGNTSSLDSALVRQHSQTLTGLIPDTLYHFRVLSTDASGNPAASADFTFQTLPMITSVSSGNITATSALVTWSTNDPGDSQVEYGETTAYGSSTALDPALVSSHSVTLTGLTPDTPYHFRALSTDAFGHLSTSADFTFQTLPMITGVSAGNITATGAVISWSTNQGTSSQVEYGETTAYGNLSPVDPGLVTSHSQSLGGLQPDTLYHFRVLSQDGSGNVWSSADFTFQTPPMITGVSAGNLTATSAVISWSTNQGTSSQVEYGDTTAYGNATTVDPFLVTIHSQSLSGLLPDTLYHFRVLSTDASANLWASADFTFQTPPLPPPPPVDTPPQVNLTAPADSSTVLGASVVVSADATDDIGVLGVQFRLNGSNLGNEDTTAPYSTVLDTTKLLNGVYTLTAIARDASGHLTTSAPFTVTVENNYALTFDGVDDVVTAASQSPPVPLSVSVWIKPASLGENNSGHIFSVRDDADNNPNIQFRLISGNKLRLLVIFDNAGQLSIGYWDTPANSVTLNALQHVALSYDGSSAANNPVIYVNGVLQALTRGSTPVGVLRTDAAIWRIGNNPATSATFQGLMDEVRIYNRILSAIEVATHFNNGQILRGQPEPGLVAGWHFDENTGIIAFDYSGNGNHAFLVNGTKWVPN